MFRSLDQSRDRKTRGRPHGKTKIFGKREAGRRKENAGAPKAKHLGEQDARDDGKTSREQDTEKRDSNSKQFVTDGFEPKF